MAMGAEPQQPQLASLRVWYKNEFITPQGSYLGEVWNDLDRFQRNRGGRTFTHDLKAVGLDSQGKQVAVDATWTASNPAMVDLSPGQGRQVKLTIKKAGKSAILVNAGKVTRKLTVKAAYRKGEMLVEITQ
ncbi:MAG: hypothetical protein FJ126_13370 [Deltaproteobacteria bacterium]|nr:hypothetical protein [Deltaproteobacteria bacterium]